MQIQNSDKILNNIKQHHTAHCRGPEQRKQSKQLLPSVLEKLRVGLSEDLSLHIERLSDFDSTSEKSRMAPILGQLLDLRTMEKSRIPKVICKKCWCVKLDFVYIHQCICKSWIYLKFAIPGDPMFQRLTVWDAGLLVLSFSQYSSWFGFQGADIFHPISGNKPQKMRRRRRRKSGWSSWDTAGSKN